MKDLEIKPSKVIIGSWISNKEKSMNEAFINFLERKDQYKIYEKVLGQIKCQYTETEIFHGYETPEK